MNYPDLILRPGSERTLLKGHPWVFSGALAQPPRQIEPGAIVDVRAHNGRFVGRGYCNPRSAIPVRLLSRDPQRPIDAAFVRHALARACRLRRENPLLAHSSACRLVHGESDGLPGLVVDHYAGFAVVQFHTVGMERLRAAVLDALGAVLSPRGIYERSDVGTRRAEGLPDRPTGPLRGEEPPEYIEIEEGGTRLFVDVYRGQKTGLFLDQRSNRLLLQQLAQGCSVLNCFAFTAAFSAHALKGGARRTLDLEIAPRLWPAARHNLEANRAPSSTCDFVAADVFPFIDELAARGPRFDIVILDPPALMRRRGQLKETMGVYTKLNRNAFKLVHEGGLLVTSSCSGRISTEDFFQVVRRAAAGAGVEVRILAYNLHPPDHPVDPAFPEGRYLKCIFARVFR